MWLRKIFIRLLPARIKRAFVLTGLYSILTKQSEVNPEVLASLNESLRLVSNPNSLQFPAMSANWLDVPGSCLTGLDNPNQLIDEVTNKLPGYWKYGIEVDFKHDLQELVKYIRPGTYFANIVTQPNVFPHSASWHRS